MLNSHTHNDHVGDNWEFSEIYGMDTEFTRINAKGSTVDAQAELVSGSICGHLPAGFDAKSYATRPFHINRWIHDGDTLDLGGRVLKVIQRPGIRPMRFACWTARMDCYLQEIISTPDQSGCTGLKRISTPMFIPLSESRHWRLNFACSCPRITFPWASLRNCRSW